MVEKLPGAFLRIFVIFPKASRNRPPVENTRSYLIYRCTVKTMCREIDDSETFRLNMDESSLRILTPIG